MCFGSTKQSTAQSTTPQMPEWMAHDMAANSYEGRFLKNQPFQAWDGPSTTGMTGTQQQASGITAGAAGFQPQQITAPSNPTQVAAGNSVQQMGGIAALGIDNADLSRYSDPYTSAVKDAAFAEIDRSTAKSRQQQAGQAAQQGAFGGDRAAIVDAEMQGAGMRSKATLGSQIDSAAFQNAQTMAGQDINRRLGAVQQQNGQDLTASLANQNTATAYDQMDMSAQGANQTAGLSANGQRLQAGQQLFQQGTIDQASQEAGRQFDYGEYLRRVNDPYQKLQWSQGITSGMAPYFTTQNTSGHTPGPSVFSQVMGGIGAVVGGAALLSDRDDKTDIKKLGVDPETGQTMYAYRYKDDPKSYPKIVGPMAQDVEAAGGNVREIGGHKVIGLASGGIAEYANGGIAESPIEELAHLSPGAKALLASLGGEPLPGQPPEVAGIAPPGVSPEAAAPAGPMPAAPSDASPGVSNPPVGIGGPPAATDPSMPLPPPGPVPSVPEEPLRHPSDWPTEPEAGGAPEGAASSRNRVATAPAQDPGPPQAAPRALPAISLPVFQPDPKLAVPGAGPTDPPIPADPKAADRPTDAMEAEGIAATRPNPAAADRPTDAQEAAGIAGVPGRNPEAEASIADTIATIGKAKDGKTAEKSAAAAAEDFESRIGTAESSNNWAAQNRQGYTGRYQFGTARLADLGFYRPGEGEDLKGNQWRGSLSIPGFENVRTIEDFKRSPEAQRAVFKEHIRRIDAAIDATPGAAAFDRNGLRSVAHLGGEGGMRRFVESGGQYNPADSNGTTLAAYYNRFAGSDRPPPADAPRMRGKPEGIDTPPAAAPAPAGTATAQAAGTADARASGIAAKPPEKELTYMQRLSRRMLDPDNAAAMALLQAGATTLSSRSPGNASIGEGISAGVAHMRGEAVRQDRREERKDAREERTLTREALSADRAANLDERRTHNRALEAQARETAALRRADAAERAGRHDEMMEFRRQAAQAQQEYREAQQQLVRDRLQADKDKRTAEAKDDEGKAEERRERQVQTYAQRRIAAHAASAGSNSETWLKNPINRDLVDGEVLEYRAQHHPTSPEAKAWADDVIKPEQERFNAIPPGTSPDQLDTALRQAGIPAERRKQLVLAWKVQQANAARTTR